MMTLNTAVGILRSVNRSTVFNEVLKMYKEDRSMLAEFPLHFEFKNEMAVDQGGGGG